jgi:hypothetical protein
MPVLRQARPQHRLTCPRPARVLGRPHRYTLRAVTPSGSKKGEAVSQVRCWRLRGQIRAGSAGLVRPPRWGGTPRRLGARRSLTGGRGSRRLGRTRARWLVRLLNPRQKVANALLGSVTGSCRLTPTAEPRLNRDGPQHPNISASEVVRALARLASGLGRAASSVRQARSATRLGSARPAPSAGREGGTPPPANRASESHRRDTTAP